MEECSWGLLHNIVDCPVGWTRHGTRNKCYKFFNEKTSGFKAKQRCRDQGGNLASIEDKAANEFVSKVLLKDVTQWVSQQVYIGGEQYKEFGHTLDNWAWLDGSIFGFTNWGDSEQIDHGAEDCMSMQLQDFLRGVWNDVACDIDHWFSYVCSMDIITGIIQC